MGAPRRSFVISDLPKKRSDALLLNSAYYFTGRPCKHGHIEPRSAAGGRCRQCGADSTARMRRTPEGMAYNREYMSRFRHTPKGRAWMRRGSSKRRAAQRNAIPRWADMEKINEFISGCPSGFDIDHIIPLAGDNVCGLHVLENLQVLPKKENNSKYNRVDPLTLDYAVCPLPGHRTYLHT